MDELDNLIKPDPLYTDKDMKKEKNRQLGTANNKKRYTNRYTDTYKHWKTEACQYVA